MVEGILAKVVRLILYLLNTSAFRSLGADTSKNVLFILNSQLFRIAGKAVVRRDEVES